MNSQGRHYRDQTDTTKPVCDYPSCDFFSSGTDTNIPYPSDISLGPVGTDGANGHSSDLASILQLLQLQKSESEKQNAQLQQLQQQVVALTQNRVPAPPIPTQAYTQATPSAPPPAPSFSTPVTAPHVVASAAASLSSHLQSGLQDNFGYSGLNIEQLRSNTAVVSEANRVLASSTAGVPPLNPHPLTGMGAALGMPGNGNNQVTSVDQLYRVTTVNKQLRAYEFAATGQFPYKSLIKQDNVNAISFAYGAFKHLEAIKSGLITMSDTEFLARLKHLKNVFEVACLSSNLTSFTDPAWQVAREYDSRVIADIEAGVKNWSTLASGLETDAIYVAKEIVDLKNKAKKPPKDPKDAKKPKEPRDPKNKACSTYNTHRSSEGCYWEHMNKGSCVFEHFCSWCKTNRDVKEKHKEVSCEHKPE